MKSESIVLAVAGICFGVIVGWVLATVDAGRRPAVPQAPAAAAPAATASASADDRQPPVLDEARVQALTTILQNDPKNSGAAVQLGTVYFEAERFDEARKWYEEGLRLDPKNADASTQLGMTYFVTQGADPALKQFEHSLEISPNHPRTLLNKGIVLWRGKQDLKGAAAVWQKLVASAPNTPEAQMAQQGLQAIGASHEEGATQPPGNP
jgi:cytochrome c-type biogenesis protein CcmH/NrfG